MSEDEIISWANGEVDGPTLRIRELGRDLGQVKAELAETRNALLQMQKERDAAVMETRVYREHCNQYRERGDKWKALADQLAHGGSLAMKGMGKHWVSMEPLRHALAAYEAATKGDER